MHLKQITITNFKNYVSQYFEFSPSLNVLTGKNGMGKTNCLDAVHYLCLCKSNQGISDRDLVLKGSDFFRLEGVFSLHGNTEKMVAKYPKGGRKVFEQNDVAFPRLADYIGTFPVVMIAPDDTELIREGSEERRRFMDTTLSQLDKIYLNHLIKYNHILKQRNGLLRQFADSGRFDAVLLLSLDRQIYAPAAAIHAYRQTFAAEISPIFNNYYAIISGDVERVSIYYESKLNKLKMEELLLEYKARDLDLGRTAQGVHRDELVFKMNGSPVKKFGSQGQLKSFFLALRLAQYEMFRQKEGKTPILLLDDVFDKLDANRVGFLIDLLKEKSFGQVFITDTQKERMEPIIEGYPGGYKLFEIEAGRVL